MGSSLMLISAAFIGAKSKKSNVMKYFYNIKSLFSICIRTLILWWQSVKLMMLYLIGWCKYSIYQEGQTEQRTNQPNLESFFQYLILVKRWIGHLKWSWKCKFSLSMCHSSCRHVQLTAYKSYRKKKEKVHWNCNLLFYAQLKLKC